MRKDLFAAIDFHSNNNYLAVIDSKDRRLVERRLRNDLSAVVSALEPYRKRLAGVAVESTFNWYWLVDGLASAGHEPRLVNTSAVRQYEGLKHTHDRHDAFWLAHMMRLGILPTGHVMEPAARALRDLLRRRMRLVQQRTANILSVENLQGRNEGVRMSSDQIKAETTETIARQVADPNRALALRSTQAVIMTLNEQIGEIERSALRQLRRSADWKHLQTIWGIGQTLAAVIQLETARARQPRPRSQTDRRPGARRLWPDLRDAGRSPRYHGVGSGQAEATQPRARCHRSRVRLTQGANSLSPEEIAARR